MTSLAVGKDVLSHCNRCKLNLSHIIVTMKDDEKPGKVKCNTCGATHAFKDPNKVTKKKKTTTRKRTSKKETINDDWSKRMKAFKGEEVAYSPKGSYIPGDLIDHPTFGKGFVEKKIDLNKIEIIFEEEIKILVHNIK